MADGTKLNNSHPAPWGGGYMNFALLSIGVDCIFVPMLVKYDIIPTSLDEIILPIWPINYEFAKQMAELGATERYIYSVTTAVSVAFAISASYFVVRLILEYVYRCKVIVSGRIFVFIILSAALFYVSCAYEISFQSKFNIYTVNMSYSPSVNCLIIAIQMFALIVFSSELVCHIARYIRVAYDRIEKT
jgi:hypothetical protein